MSQSCLAHRRRCVGPLEHAGPPFLAQSVAVAADRDHVAVVQQVIEDRGRDDRIAEYLAPLAGGRGAGDEQAPRS